jgi:hypothetical protein
VADEVGCDGVELGNERCEVNIWGLSAGARAARQYIRTPPCPYGGLELVFCHWLGCPLVVTVARRIQRGSVQAVLMFHSALHAGCLVRAHNVGVVTVPYS